LSKRLLRLYISLATISFLLIGCGTQAATSNSLDAIAPAVADVEFATLTPNTPDRPVVPTPTPDSLPATVATPIYGYRVIADFPHDQTAWTQGLIYAGNERLYEGTGLRGQSSLRLVAIGATEPEQLVELEPQYFGEGITRFDERIFQLTWQEQTGFIYDAATLEQTGTFSYPPAGSLRPVEGWGLTHDGSRLIMSDGSATLYFLDPQTLSFIGEMQVFDTEGPVVRLNELEYINGEVWANLWLTDLVARIDLQTGQVNSYVDFSGLLTHEERRQADVLNGIAYDPATGRIFVTGKRWPRLFQIEVVAPTGTLPFRHYAPYLAQF
jgi:glutamine cyclotransferase